MDDLQRNLAKRYQPVILATIVSLVLVNGCAGLPGSPGSPVAPGHLDSDKVVRVQQIAPSSTGKIAILRYPSMGYDGYMSLISSLNDKREMFQGSYDQTQWSPDGSNLIVTKDSASTHGPDVSETFIYNVHSGTFHLFSQPNEQVIQYCWLGNNKIAFGAGVPGPEFTKKLFVRTLDGHTLEASTLSNGATMTFPFRLVFDPISGNIVANLVFVKPGSPSLSWIYLINHGSRISVAGSLGSTREIAISPTKPQAFFVIQAGKRNKTSVIATFDTSSPNPVATPLLNIAQAHLPGMAQSEITGLQCSPDGKRLLMTLIPSTGPSVVVTYEIETGKFSKITDGSLAIFSPNGQKIVYAAEYSVKDQSLLVFGKRVDQKGVYLPGNRIYECQADGSQCSILDDPPLLAAPSDAAPPGIWPRILAPAVIVIILISIFVAIYQMRRTRAQ